MARKPRIWYPGATYHITARGNRRDSIFLDRQDYQRYLNLVKACWDLDSFNIHAYCLMPNHIHLLLETTDKPPGTIIKSIHTRYAMYFNKRYELTGHVFQGRFHSRLIMTNDYFLTVSKYIHQNPVEANIVEKPEHYLWSSFPSYLGKTKKAPILEMERVLSLFSEPRSLTYQKYVTEQNKDSPLPR